MKRELDFVFVGRMEQVIDAALEEKPAARVVKPAAPAVPVAMA